MLAAAIVCPDSLSRLRDALGVDHVDAFSDLKQLSHALTIGRYDVLVVDPERFGTRSRLTLCRTVATVGLPVLAYSGSTAFGIDSLVRLLPAGVQAIILHGSDDDSDHIRQAIRSITGSSYSIQFLASLAPNLGRLRASPQLALVTTFTTAETVCPKGLAEIAGTSRRSLDRAMRDEGLRPIGWLVRAARLLKVLDFAGVGDRRYGRLRATGDSSRRSFKTDVRAVLRIGAPEFFAAAGLDPDAVLQRITASARLNIPLELRLRASSPFAGCSRVS